VTRRTRALVAAAICATAASLVGFAAFNVAAIESSDGRLEAKFFELRREGFARLADAVFDALNPWGFALMAAALLAVALLRRRPGIAAAVGLIVVGANLTTQLLQRITASERSSALVSLADSRWPSGHTTAAVTLAVCLVLVVSARFRAVAAAFGALAIMALVLSILILGMHLPSDVLGAMLVAGAWTGLALAVLRRPDHQPHRRH
jgi:membrane-associated phospholipid phosphatase